MEYRKEELGKFIDEIFGNGMDGGVSGREEVKMFFGLSYVFFYFANFVFYVCRALRNVA